MTELKVNPTDIERFFNFLAPSKDELFSGWFCSKDGNMPIKELGNLYRPPQWYVKYSREIYDREKGTLHIVLNRCSDKGRRKENVQSVRVLCVDLDSVTPLPLIKDHIQQYQPGMVVESSPGKYHMYWKVDSSTPLSTWSDYQLGLAHYFGGDKNLKGISHSIRCPGIPRITKTGEEFLPRIVWLEKGNPSVNTLNDINKLFPDILQNIEDAKKEESNRRKSIDLFSKGKKLSKKQLSELAESGRNDAIFAYVLRESLSSRGRHPSDTDKWITEEQACLLAHKFYESLPVSADKEPLSDLEIEKTARSAWKDAQINAENALEERQEKEKEREAKVEYCYDYSDSELARNRFTDAAILARVVQRYGDSILHDPTSGVIYAFDPIENIWRKQNNKGQPGNFIYHYADKVLNDVINDPQFETEFCSTEKEGSELRRRTVERQFKSNEKRDSVARSIIRCPALNTVAFEAFDADLDRVLCGNGVLNMVTGELRAPVAKDMLLFRTRVEFIPDAKCPGWEKFINQVFAENENPEHMVSFKQELFGYSLSGRINASKIFCHFGDGSNGKSKALEALMLLCGEYATTLSATDLVSKRNQTTKDPERLGSKIEGKRCAIVDDISTNTVWDEGVLKGFTAKQLPARRLYGEPTRFFNRCTAHVGLNKAPSPESSNNGLFRRMCIIPYNRTFEPCAAMDEKIDEMIRRELSGILNWAIEGYQRLRKRGGFDYPKEITAAVEEYRDINSPLEKLIQELYRTPINGEYKKTELIKVQDVLNRVNDDLRNQNREPINAIELGRLISRVFKVKSEVYRVNNRSERGYSLIKIGSTQTENEKDKTRSLLSDVNNL